MPEQQSTPSQQRYFRVQVMMDRPLLSDLDDLAKRRAKRRKQPKESRSATVRRLLRTALALPHELEGIEV